MPINCKPVFFHYSELKWNETCPTAPTICQFPAATLVFIYIDKSIAHTTPQVVGTVRRQRLLKKKKSKRSRGGSRALPVRTVIWPRVGPTGLKSNLTEKKSACKRVSVCVFYPSCASINCRNAWKPSRVARAFCKNTKTKSGTWLIQKVHFKSATVCHHPASSLLYFTMTRTRKRTPYYLERVGYEHEHLFLVREQQR